MQCSGCGRKFFLPGPDGVVPGELMAEDVRLDVVCPNCGDEYEVGVDAVGLQGTCKRCSTVFEVGKEAGAHAVEQPANSPDRQSTPSGAPVPGSHLPNDDLPSDENTVTCPHCWTPFAHSEVRFISQHADLIGDEVLGPDAQIRFLPSEFTVEGLALDRQGLICTDRACPRCHLPIPNSLLSQDSLFFSLVGAPSSGKSYLLAAMTAMLRRQLPDFFGVHFSDVDARANVVLNGYEDALFRSASPDQLAALPKTEQRGDSFSNQALIDGMVVDLPTPFFFALRLAENHPCADEADEMHRNLVLYDNAGEHFQPGADSAANPATLHLVHSEGLIFLFDPSCDAQMRTRCNPDDPQLKQKEKVSSQYTLLTEMVNRIERHRGARANGKYEWPLIVSVSKYDMWAALLEEDLRSVTPWRVNPETMVCEIDIEVVMRVSFQVRELLLEFCPEIVHIAEAFARKVFFVPTSALGGAPTEVETGDGVMIAVRPEDMAPIWASVPVLLLLAGKEYVAAAPAGEAPAQEIHQVTNFRLKNDWIACALPGRSMPLNLPASYAGYPLYDPKSKAWFEIGAASSVNTPLPTDERDDDFWN
ncbi:MAG: hypothetical protein HOJ57_43195 [Lentisphaerae bacterium]|nr:hypothetical protein [Lentisphaerota bacterium]MBT5612821.1 hypothetical protein [Lentisphaerota bacterium]MBT7056006.1 hypothetical protein [Lentisphaerota bacterium]